ncbi:AraC family transcriptional regulator [Maribacter sp. TH_r10]|uniref:Helix-turn-helix domain-containing protein n=1 Tax=Maribacter luteus TaxID=2594478 RepID=A0A6I2MLW6_9FLAO|nr:MULTISPECIES: AraC family transcriptional regulator [Maribacter]MDV7140399.1 AraC family transcriptional regulator [Maribacter sp. TH_r10]MRX64728.1 helix-turn-helix domain-containing protein [Maribacter luteus]
MLLNKPVYKKLNSEFGNSILMVQRTERLDSKTAFWHFHPELELHYVNKGHGKRHVGNHISYFNNSQLLLIGENLPHKGFTDGITNNGMETIIQFKKDFLGDAFFDIPEMKNIKTLFEKANKGLLFNPIVKKEIGPKIEELVNYQGYEKIIKFLDVLHDLSLSDDYRILNPEGFNFEVEPQNTLKIDIIYKYVNNNFKNQIALEEVADAVSMTVPSFCRYFKRVTGKTFTKLVNEYRIVHATKLIQESQLGITDICYECGFNSFSHFNKMFKEITGESASKYRSNLKTLVQ